MKLVFLILMHRVHSQIYMKGKYKMKSLLKCLAIALVMGVLFYGFDAAAAGNDIFTRAFNTLANVFKNVRVIVYILGAFGLIGLAIAFIFGKMQFKWLALLAIGLAIVAAADMIVSYAVKGGSTDQLTGDISNADWESQLR